KMGLRPDWAINEGRGEPAPYAQYAEQYPPSAPAVPKLKEKEKGGMYMGKQLSEEAEAFTKERSKIIKQMRKEGYTPYIDPARRTYVDPANYPGANVDTLSIQPQREATMKEYKKWIDAPETMKQLEAAYKRGTDLGNAN